MAIRGKLFSGIGGNTIAPFGQPLKYGILGPQAANALEVFAHATANYEKPEFQ